MPNDINNMQSLSLRKLALAFPDAWKDFLEVWNLTRSLNDSISMENGWFLYSMGFHMGRLHMARAEVLSFGAVRKCLR